MTALPFDCADCNSAEPEDCMKASYCQHRDGPRAPSTLYGDAAAMEARRHGADSFAGRTFAHTDVQPSEVREEERLREVFERMIRKPYAKDFEAVPWHVLERSETDARFYRNADTLKRWEDFQAGAAALTKDPRDDR